MVCLICYFLRRFVSCFCVTGIHFKCWRSRQFWTYIMPDLKYLYRVLYILINCFFKQIVDIISYKLSSDRLSLFGRSVNCWRVSALARTLQLFTDRPNNHSRSRNLRSFLCDAADLWLETVTKCFPRTMFDGLSLKF